MDISRRVSSGEGLRVPVFKELPGQRWESLIEGKRNGIPHRGPIEKGSDLSISCFIKYLFRFPALSGRLKSIFGAGFAF